MVLKEGVREWEDSRKDLDNLTWKIAGETYYLRQSDLLSREVLGRELF